MRFAGVVALIIMAAHDVGATPSRCVVSNPTAAASDAWDSGKPVRRLPVKWRYRGTWFVDTLCWPYPPADTVYVERQAGSGVYSAVAGAVTNLTDDYLELRTDSAAQMISRQRIVRVVLDSRIARATDALKTALSQTLPALASDSVLWTSPLPSSAMRSARDVAAINELARVGYWDAGAHRDEWLLAVHERTDSTSVVVKMIEKTPLGSGWLGFLDVMPATVKNLLGVLCVVVVAALGGYHAYNAFVVARSERTVSALRARLELAKVYLDLKERVNNGDKLLLPLDTGELSALLGDTRRAQLLAKLRETLWPALRIKAGSPEAEEILRSWSERFRSPTRIGRGLAVVRMLTLQVVSLLLLICAGFGLLVAALYATTIIEQPSLLLRLHLGDVALTAYGVIVFRLALRSRSVCRLVISAKRDVRNRNSGKQSATANSHVSPVPTAEGTSPI